MTKQKVTGEISKSSSQGSPYFGVSVLISPSKKVTIPSELTRCRVLLQDSIKAFSQSP